MTIIKVEVLPDGSVRVETDKVGQVEHMSAEKFLEFIKKEMGGEVTIKNKPGAHHHHHHKKGHHHRH